MAKTASGIITRGRPDAENETGASLLRVLSSAALSFSTSEGAAIGGSIEGLAEEETTVGTGAIGWEEGVGRIAGKWEPEAELVRIGEDDFGGKVVKGNSETGFEGFTVSDMVSDRVTGL